jgi:hypothetical protein
MVCIGGGLLFIFVRKQWIWTRESKVPETVHEQNKREKRNGIMQKESLTMYSKNE